ncbi:MAG: ester cyclase [Actinomycetota bacterium]
MDSNKEVARRFYEEAFNGRHVAVLDELAVSDYEEHDPLPGQGTGLAGLKERVQMVIDGLDPHFAIEDMIAEGEKVVVRWTNSGTNSGEFLGMPPTGRSFSIQGIDIYRLADGKLAEHWHVVDMLAHLQQLGFLPAPEGV